MIDLTACLELLFLDASPNAPQDRVRRAADAGITAVEIWFWRDKDLRALSQSLRASDVKLYAMMSEPMARLVDPATHDAFVKGVVESAAVANDLGCKYLMVFSGEAIQGKPRASQRQAVIDVLRRAAPIAEDHGVSLLLECLNSRIDHPGHFLDRTADGIDIVEEVASSSVRLLYDVYHSYVMGETAESVLSGKLDRVGHIQVADVPGRHEPGSGAIDWRRLLDWLMEEGYQGPIGLEYVPVGSTEESLVRAKASLGSRA